MKISLKQIFQQFFYTDKGVQTETAHVSVQPAGKVTYQYSLHFCNIITIFSKHVYTFLLTNYFAIFQLIA